MLTETMSRSGDFLFRWRSFLPLAFMPFLVWAAWDGEAVELAWGHQWGGAVEWLGIALVVVGQVLRILTVGFVPRGTSGRNTDKGQIAEVLNVTGLYSVTRNPLYLANCTIYLGLAVYAQHPLLTLVLALALALYYERIILAEERFLVARFGQAYRDWAARTPAFFPRLSGWVAPGMPFSLRTVIRREHASILGAVVMLYLLEMGLHWLPATPIDGVEPVWHWVAGGALALDLGIILAKRAGWLSVAGR